MNQENCSLNILNVKMQVFYQGLGVLVLLPHTMQRILMKNMALCSWHKCSGSKSKKHCYVLKYAHNTTAQIKVAIYFLTEIYASDFC